MQPQPIAQPDTPKRPSGGGPTIGQAFVWGCMAAVITAVGAVLGKLLSSAPQAPVPVDSLHGLSNPAEMNQHIEALLAAGGAALAHDHSLAGKFQVLVVALCVLCLLAAMLYILRLRGRLIPSRGRTAGVILLLALPPVVATVAISIREDALFQARPILQVLENENTRPRVVRRGEKAGVRIPVTMQSFFGYHESETFSLTSSVARLPDGNRIPVTLGNPTMAPGGRKPGKTDVIPLMEDVTPMAEFTIPDDPKLSGAVIEVAASGILRILPAEHPDAFTRRAYTASTTFRVATDKEVQFAGEYAQISEDMRMLNAFSWPSFAAIVIGIFFATPVVCVKCMKRVNRFKLYEGRLCWECSQKDKAGKAAAGPAASPPATTAGTP